MSSIQSRDEVLSHLDDPWDVLVIGGGITGAGIAREATRAGLRVLVVEQRDFAWGTSSRSSKLVHGGLRYLREGLLRLVWESVRERERLLRDAPGLVDPLPFILANYTADEHGRLAFGLALAVYDLIAGTWKHQYANAEQIAGILPGISREGLAGGFRYYDASTDDARLVVRVLREAAASGACALNHTAVTGLVREEGRVVGVRAVDGPTGGEREIRARVVVNATGVWVDRLRAEVGGERRMRPLRGSHLIFAAARFPVKEALALQHPSDRRVMFVFPWQGVTVVGTTDLDHREDLGVEPGISGAEVAYLMTAVEARFPELQLTLDDVVSSYSGVRPVVSTGKADPSAETRDHVVWDEEGLITVTGGKLTTFRIIAHDAMETVVKHLGDGTVIDHADQVLDPLPTEVAGLESLPEEDRLWLLGRHAAETAALLAIAQPGDLEHVGDTSFLWVELRWAARSEWVVHLDDLLLRRVRVGLLVAEGGRALLPRVREVCAAELGWDDARWAQEEVDYLALWARCYSLPDRATIPEWRVGHQDRAEA